MVLSSASRSRHHSATKYASSTRAKRRRILQQDAEASQSSPVSEAASSSSMLGLDASPSRNKPKGKAKEAAAGPTLASGNGKQSKRPAPQNASQESSPKRRTSTSTTPSKSPKRLATLKPIIKGSPHRSPRTPTKAPKDLSSLFHGDDLTGTQKSSMQSKSSAMIMMEEEERGGDLTADMQLTPGPRRTRSTSQRLLAYRANGASSSSSQLSSSPLAEESLNGKETIPTAPTAKLASRMSTKRSKTSPSAENSRVEHKQSAPHHSSPHLSSPLSQAAASPRPGSGSQTPTTNHRAEKRKASSSAVAASHGASSLRGNTKTYGMQRSFLVEAAHLHHHEKSGLHESLRKNIDVHVELLPGHVNANGSAKAEANDMQDSLDADESQRSALANAALMEMETAEGKPKIRESYKDLLQKWGQGDLENEPKSTMEVKSISSLRSAGEIRRFTDELEYLLSSLDPTRSLATRQTACLEAVLRTCTKLDAEAEKEGLEDLADEVSKRESHRFLHGLRLSDNVQTLFHALHACGCGARLQDEAYDSSGLLDAILALYIARLSSAEVDMTEGLTGETADAVLEIISRMLVLTLQRDVLQMPPPSKGPNRKLKQPLIALKQAILASDLSLSKQKGVVSTRDLLLFSLAQLISVTSAELVSTLIEQASNSPSQGEDPSQAEADTIYSVLSDLFLEDAKARPRVPHRDLLYHMCFASLLARGEELTPEQHSLMRDKITPLMVTLRRRFEQHDDEEVHDVYLLRLLILATQDHAANSDALASSDYFLEKLCGMCTLSDADWDRARRRDADNSPHGSANPQHVQKAERACVLLGLLTNILEHCAGKRLALTQMNIGDSGETGLTLLSTDFAKSIHLQHSTSDDDGGQGDGKGAVFGIMTGCLAVALGLLIDDNSSASRDFASTCQDVSAAYAKEQRGKTLDHQEWRRTLVDALEHFADANDAMESQEGENHSQGLDQDGEDFDAVSGDARGTQSRDSNGVTQRNMIRDLARRLCESLGVPPPR